ncbi:MAG: tryptophan 7-halogenase [Nitrospira sp.]|nr:tryptophan 7-halogenase [Nitrospira sp.]MDH4243766.1 tryptophan 7-halogenase [Nitrospira sp.]MDH4356432.1 tryptophan 7-halogenase [Nitrospira sp.]MDH5318786.1 tryptophan 7-halogenase [Nitrospira sp.]
MPLSQRDTTLPTPCDVLVVGGGPAGSTISALLAEKGWNVHVLEKDRHPRFHIGESLLPHSLPMLQRLGVLGDVEKIGITKYGAEVVSPYHGRSRTLYFSKALDGSQPFAYQVKRAEFDKILFNNAVSKGAHLHEEVKAKKVEFRPGSTHLVQAEDRVGQPLAWEAKFVVDASGRDTFLSGQLGGKHRNPHHNCAAIFGHFEGVKRLPGMDEGNISIVWFDHGWWWIIPFKDGTTSVGAVCWPSYISRRKGSLEQFLQDTIALCPPVAERMAQASLIGQAYAAANYSYRRETMRGDCYLMIGDAFAFIDPVFSSGVHLALNSATLGADVVDASLRGAPEYEACVKEFERSVRLGVKTYSWFIYHFTQPAFRALFMSTGSIFKMEEAVLSILAGDAFGRSPTRVPILLFKIAYYLVYLFNFRENWTAYRRRITGVTHTVTDVTDYAVNQRS